MIEFALPPENVQCVSTAKSSLLYFFIGYEFKLKHFVCSCHHTNWF